MPGLTVLIRLRLAFALGAHIKAFVRAISSEMAT